MESDEGRGSDGGEREWWGECMMESEGGGKWKGVMEGEGSDGGRRE